jgi:D-serine deaminase-like pyridoxal phosphate-dependent protein
LGAAGLAAGAAGTAALWRPTDRGGPHDAYFAGLNEMLKREGPGRPLMLLDLDRINHNVDALAGSVGREKTYRIVVKSLPSLDLLRHVMARARSGALMVFHQPFLNAVAESLPGTDVLLGKPMPVSAARTFYRELRDPVLEPSRDIQWLIDTRERLEEYQALARTLGTHMRISIEIDLGLHRGGLPEPEALDSLLHRIAEDPEHLSFAGFMGYEPHLAGLGAELDHPAVRHVLAIYNGFIERARQHGIDPSKLTLNGAGSHTLRIYERDRTMNDLAAGSGVVKPSDFDTHHLRDQQPAVFIAAPVLKRYPALKMPGDPWALDVLQRWDPNMRELYFIYGGYWKANYVSPPGISSRALYRSSNQEPFAASNAVDLAIGDYVFLRPTQSEQVMLQFGALAVVQNARIVEYWSVFGQEQAESSRST